MTLIVYGITNCDTVRKARAYLDTKSIDYAFHDYKKAGVDRVSLERWVDEAGWETLLNRAGTTFRKLADADKTGIDRDKAVALMLAHPSAIKRPVVEGGGRLLIGFKPEDWAQSFG